MVCCVLVVVVITVGAVAGTIWRVVVCSVVVRVSCPQAPSKATTANNPASDYVRRRVSSRGFLITIDMRFLPLVDLAKPPDYLVVVVEVLVSVVTMVGG